MKDEIRKRINAVRRGEVPEGYIVENHQLRPLDWKYEKIGKYLVAHDEYSNDTERYMLATSSRQGLLPQTDYYNDQRFDETVGGFHIVPEGYVTYRHMSDDDVFKFNVNDLGTPVLVSPEYPVFTTNAELNQSLLIEYLNGTNEFRSFCRAQKKGSTRTRMYFSRLGEFMMPIPPISEQQKITDILASCDRVIDLKQKRVDELKQLKKTGLAKIFPRDGADVPELRFPGFTAPWEQRRIGDNFSFLQNNTLSRAELDEDGGEAKNVHYGDILTELGDVLDISHTQLPYIPSASISDKYRGSFLHDGDVVMADTAEDETVGKCTEVVNANGDPVLAGLHTIPMRPNEKYAAGYLGYYMNSPAYHNQLLPLMQGIKVTSVSKSAILNTLVLCPPELTEQAAIGRYFIEIDNLINLLQRELEADQQKKKALMQLLLTGLVRV